jgi:acyl-CoA synthetase (AMP-forming)/AMP-acid ligase II
MFCSLLESLIHFCDVFSVLCWQELVPVPLPPLGETYTTKVFLERIKSVSMDCGAAAAVVSTPDAFNLDSLCLNIPVIASDEAWRKDLPLHNRATQDIAFIQYTSGSTARPRGVVVTHGNLLANCKAIANGCKFVVGDRAITWLPLYHDMGLVGSLLTAIYSNTPIYVMPPSLFMSRPVAWLRVLHTFEATISVAPTFAYRLCAHRIPDRQLEGLDLKQWRIAFVGAEHIDVATLKAFAKRFSVYGFRASTLTPVYGLAEATLAVTFSDVGKSYNTDSVCRVRIGEHGVASSIAATSPDAISFVSVGRALENHSVTIVDPLTGRILPERCVGEIVVQGPSVTPRYLNEKIERSVLRTGDLGYVASGELFICDRLKDIIIIGGRNYFPTDIEMTVATQVSGLRNGKIVAFSAGIREIECLYIAAEVSCDAADKREELKAAICNAVANSYGLSVADILLLKRGTLPRTSSGKVQRRLCASLFAPRQEHTNAVPAMKN